MITREEWLVQVALFALALIVSWGSAFVGAALAVVLLGLRAGRGRDQD